MEKQVHRAYLSQAMYQMLTYIKETFVIKHNYEDIQYTEHQVWDVQAIYDWLTLVLNNLQEIVVEMSVIK